jgi:hypothetical protein
MPTPCLLALLVRHGRDDQNGNRVRAHDQPFGQEEPAEVLGEMTAASAARAWGTMR